MEVSNPDGTASTNLVVDPRITQGIETGKAIVALTAPVNPYAGIMTTVLGVASTIAVAWGSIATFFMRRRGQVLSAVVRGVEASGTGGSAVKESIEKVSEKAGLARQVDIAVQKIVNG